jgi:ABC-type lipoprotein release transport system permease subunit
VSTIRNSLLTGAIVRALRYPVDLEQLRVVNLASYRCIRGVVGGLVGTFVGRKVGWLIGGSVGAFVGWLVGWLVGWVVAYFYLKLNALDLSLPVLAPLCLSSAHSLSSAKAFSLFLPETV